MLPNHMASRAHQPMNLPHHAMKGGKRLCFPAHYVLKPWRKIRCMTEHLAFQPLWANVCHVCHSVFVPLPASILQKKAELFQSEVGCAAPTACTATVQPLFATAPKYGKAVTWLQLQFQSRRSLVLPAIPTAPFGW